MVAQSTIDGKEADLVLLQRYISTGDAEVFAEIVRRHSAAVYTTCRRILNDDFRAQEVSQETFFRLLRQPGMVTQSVGGWLHRSATHLAIDERRSDIARRARERQYRSDYTPKPIDRENTWESLSPHVDAAIEELSEPGRTLLTRHFLEAVPQADLATEMNLSAATISRKVKSAVAELRDLLKKKGIYVGLIALIEFCKSESAKAAPVRLMTELTKMALVGPIDVTAAPMQGPRAHRPGDFLLRSRDGDSMLQMVGSCLGAIGLVACLAMGSFALSRGVTPAGGRNAGVSHDQKIIEPASSPAAPLIR